MADAKAYRRAVCGEYARDVGGGFIGPAASSVVATAALQLAMSRLYFALGDLREASRMGDASRANLLAAQEMCARSAMARGKRLPPRPDLGSTFGSG